MQKNWYYIIGAAFFFILGAVLSNTYRPYIYKNHIYDFHLADVIGNLVAVPSLVLLLLGLNRYTLPKAVLYSVFVWTIYEILPIGVFDYYDLLATLISALITYCVLRYISTWRPFKQNKIKK